MSQREPKDLNADELIECARLVRRFTWFKPVAVVDGDVACVFCGIIGEFNATGVRVHHHLSCPYFSAVRIFGAAE